MPFGLGIGELLVLFVMIVFIWGVPLLLAGWALLTLARLRKGQDELLQRLTALERRLG